MHAQNARAVTTRKKEKKVPLHAISENSIKSKSQVQICPHLRERFRVCVREPLLPLQLEEGGEEIELQLMSLLSGLPDPDPDRGRRGIRPQGGFALSTKPLSAGRPLGLAPALPQTADRKVCPVESALNSIPRVTFVESSEPTPIFSSSFEETALSLK